MIEIRQLTALDAKNTSTENLIKAIEHVAESKSKIERQTREDLANPSLDAELRADLIAINNNFLRIFERSAAILKAEIKQRLH